MPNNSKTQQSKQDYLEAQEKSLTEWSGLPDKLGWGSGLQGVGCSPHCGCHGAGVSCCGSVELRLHAGRPVVLGTQQEWPQCDCYTDSAPVGTLQFNYTVSGANFEIQTGASVPPQPRFLHAHRTSFAICP